MNLQGIKYALFAFLISGFFLPIIGVQNVCLAQQKKWFSTISASGSMNKGNVDDKNLKSELQMQRTDSLIEFSLNAKWIYAEKNSKQTNNGVNGGLKFDWKPQNRFSEFMAFEMVHNRYKGYEFKFSTLVGAKYRIWKKADAGEYSVSAALMWDNVKYVDNLAKLDRQGLRFSLRPKMRQKIGNCWLNAIAFYQPLIKDFADYIIDSNVSVESALSKRLSLFVAYSYEYHSVLPDPNKYKKTDYSTEVGLKLKL